MIFKKVFWNIKNDIIISFLKLKFPLFNILLGDGSIVNTLVESDYSNLKHLHDELTLALKMHDTAKQKKIHKMFIWLKILLLNFLLLLF